MRAYSIAHLRQSAQRRIPKVAFDFLDGGAGHETGLRENTDAFDRIRLVPRALVDVEEIDVSIELFGRRWSAPFGIAPIGLASFVWPNADVLVCRAARDAGLPYTLSTAGGASLEEIKALAPDSAWYQLYVAKSETVVTGLLERAEHAGYDVLFVTVDVPHPSRRLRDLANQLTLPLRPSPRLLLDMVLHPSWTYELIRHGPPRFGNMAAYAKADAGAQELAAFMASQSSGRLDWTMLKDIRRRWPRRLVVKGLLAPEDALAARELGADGIVVSNHGGRQLEGAIAGIEALPDIRAAVGPDFPVLLDSGIRTGEHILKALAAGASFVLVGRAVMYGVAAAGEEGARAAIDILIDEARRTAAQLGVRTLKELTPNHLRGRRLA